MKLDRFSKLIVNGVAEEKEWGFIRETKNYQDDHGVTDVTSVDLRCFQLKSGGSAATATLAAGGTLGFIADQGIDHPGPVQFYMAKTPEGKTIDTWDGSGQVWFKVAYLGDTITSKGVQWPTYSKNSESVLVIVN
jgi:Auxiliary Activity family 9 (formerly GH61)